MCKCKCQGSDYTECGKDTVSCSVDDVERGKKIINCGTNDMEHGEDDVEHGGNIVNHDASDTERGEKDAERGMIKCAFVAPENVRARRGIMSANDCAIRVDESSATSH